MDRRVKERIVGASILVAVVVLVIPELLSDPKTGSSPPETGPARSVEVDVSQNHPQPASSEPEPPPEAPPSAPPTVAPPEPPKAAVETPKTSELPKVVEPPKVAEPPKMAPHEPKPAAADKPAAPAEPAKQAAVASKPPPPTSKPSAAAGGAWAVQLGSFSKKANADRLTADLKKKGFAAYVLPPGKGGAQLFRVRVGPMADRAAAEAVQKQLNGQHQTATLVPPAP